MAEITPQVVDRRANRCKKCEGDMQPGVAIQNTLTGMPDFPGDRHAVTLSPGGPGKLIDCMKCTACGWSVTPHVTQKQILAAMHEYAWTFHGYHGRGPEVEAKHAEVVALLVEAGIS